MSQRKQNMQNIAIVLGSKSVNAVGLIRSLGQAGISVTFASNYTKIESKWTQHYLKLPEKKAGWLAPLLTYLSACPEKPVIFPTDDDTALFLDKNHAILQSRCYFSHADGRLPQLQDKATMSELALAAGLRVAPFRKLTPEECLTSDLPLPLILKPFAANAGSKGDIRICRTTQELAQSVAHLKEKGYSTVLAQEFLRFPKQYEIGLMGLSLPDGTVVIPCTIHKLRSYPPERGSTSYARIEDGIDTADYGALCTFVRSSGYVGLFDIEMIVANGEAYFIEINYRNGQYGYAPTVAGYNLPAQFCRGILGKPLEPVPPMAEIYYMNERDDRLHIRSGAITKKQWKEEFRNAHAHGMYCPGDQHPYLRQYIKIPDRIMLRLHALGARMRDLAVKEEWCVAYRTCKTSRLYEENGQKEPFRILKNSFRYWAADPFVVCENGTEYIFFEMFDRFVGKGYLGYRTVHDGKIGKMHKLYESESHLSFPFIFRHNGAYYIMPETAKERSWYLLKAISFPDKWERVHTIASGMKVCDSVFLHYDGCHYLLTQPIGEQYDFALLNTFSYNGKTLVPCPETPIVNDISAARMAGGIIYEDHRILRPGQDCSVEYGGGLTFSEILSAPSENYREKIISRVAFADISYVGAGRFHGIHTYNTDGKIEVIDLKRQPRPHLGNILNLFYRLCRKFIPRR